MNHFLAQRATITHGTVSTALFVSARTLLEMALRSGGDRSQHVPGAVILLVSSLDAELTSVATVARRVGPGDRERIAAVHDAGTVRKMEVLPQAMGASRAPTYSPALQLVVDLRNELTHYFGRDTRPGPRPAIIEELDARGLLIRRPGATGPDDDYSSDDKLMSVQLARWAFAVITDGYEAFHAAVGPITTTGGAAAFNFRTTADALGIGEEAAETPVPPSPEDGSLASR